MKILSHDHYYFHTQSQPTYSKTQCQDHIIHITVIWFGQMMAATIASSYIKYIYGVTTLHALWNSPTFPSLFLAFLPMLCYSCHVHITVSTTKKCRCIFYTDVNLTMFDKQQNPQNRLIQCSHNNQLNNVTYTYIHKSFLYSAYKFNRVTMRFGHQTGTFSEKVSNDSPVASHVTWTINSFPWQDFFPWHFTEISLTFSNQFFHIFGFSSQLVYTYNKKWQIVSKQVTTLNVKFTQCNYSTYITVTIHYMNAVIIHKLLWIGIHTVSCKHTHTIIIKYYIGRCNLMSLFNCSDMTVCKMGRQLFCCTGTVLFRCTAEKLPVTPTGQVLEIIDSALPRWKSTTQALDGVNSRTLRSCLY